MPSLLAGLLAPLDLASPLLGLTLFSLLSGALMLQVVKWTTNQQALARARDRMGATIYELRLFLDSPRRIFAAQASFLVYSARYLARLLPAFLVILPPLALLYPQLELRYGLGPLPVNEPVLLKLSLDEGIDGGAITPEALPEGVALTAPPLFLEEERLVYLRLEISAPGTHRLSLRVAGQSFTKELSADPTSPLVSAERAAGIANLWAFGAEEALPDDGGVQLISLVHPERPQRWAGLPVPWWLYWLGVASITALVLKGPLGVTL